MRILFVLEHFYPYIGGVETLFASLGKALVKEGHEVQVATSRFQKDLPRREVWQGIEIHRVPLSNRFMFTFFGAPWMVNLARKADLIHTTSYNAAVPAWSVSKITRTPAIITFHEYWGELWKTLPYLSPRQRTAFRWYERMIGKLGFRQYVAVSYFTRGRLIDAGISANRVVTIYNGVDYSELKPFQKGGMNGQSFTITYFGRLGVAKGLDFLTELIQDPEIQELPIQWQLVVPRRPAKLYEKIISDWRVPLAQGRMKLIHELERSELLQTVAKSNAVIIPSYSEGFCFAAVEAMALGVPIIHSGKGALSEVIGGKNLVIPNFPSIQGMTGVLRKAVAGRWVENPVKTFSLSECLSSHLHLYDHLNTKNWLLDTKKPGS